MRIDLHHRSIIVVLSLSALLPGCARHASVSGVVTYEGKPVSGGGVVFFPMDQGEPDKFLGRGTIDANGRYAISGMLPGKKRIQVAAARGFSFPSEATDRLAPPTLDFPDNAEGNGQIVDLQAGSNTVDIVLTKPQSTKSSTNRTPETKSRSSKK